MPSVAIREGVYKSFEITKEHFAICSMIMYQTGILSIIRLNCQMYANLPQALILKL